MAYRLSNDPQGITPPPDTDAGAWDRLTTQLGRAVTDPTAGAGVPMSFVPRNPNPPFWREAAEYFMRNPEGRLAAREAGQGGDHSFLSWFRNPQMEQDMQHLRNSYVDETGPAGLNWKLHQTARNPDPVKLSTHERNALTGGGAKGPVPRIKTAETLQRKADESMVQYLEDQFGSGAINYKRKPK